MLRDDRRMQEGARNLAIAFNVSRAEEALFRLSQGTALDPAETKFFDRLADLFSQALTGYRWIEKALSGVEAKTSLASPDSLRAFQLVVQITSDPGPNTSPAKKLDDLIKVAASLASGKELSKPVLQTFSVVLRRLSTVAAKQGMNALDAKPAPVALSVLPKVQ